MRFTQWSIRYRIALLLNMYRKEAKKKRGDDKPAIKLRTVV